MSEVELYSYDKYLEYHLYTIKDEYYFYTSIYYNGTCVRYNVKGLSYESCINGCKDIIDCWEDMGE